ncbi:MAG: hypothetical protein ABIQ64_01380 [Candidatus Saccharimonadales bacterium]
MIKKFISRKDLILRCCFVIIGIIILLAVVGVVTAIISMLFGRPIGDDYGSISTFHLKDNWIYEFYFSLTSTGRYSQSITASSLYGLLGDKIVVLLPLVTLIWFITVSSLYIRLLLIKFTGNLPLSWLYAISSGIVFTFFVLIVNNPPITTTLPGWVSFQLFFWPSGIITYTLPLLILLSGIYILFVSSWRRKFTYRLRLILFIVLLLGSSLYNEIQPAFVASISVLFICISYFKPYTGIKKYRGILIASTLTSLLGLILMYFSPGRLTRTKFLNSIEPTVQGSLIDSVIRNIFTLFRESYLRPREVILLVLTGLVVSLIFYYSRYRPKNYLTRLKYSLPYILLLPILFLLSVCISFILIAMGYGYTAGIYPRTMLLSQILYIMAIISLTFALSGMLLAQSRKLGTYSVIILTIFSSILFIGSFYKYIGKVQVQINSSVIYANQWDEQDRTLKSAASNNIKETVYLPTPATGIGDGFSLTCTGPYAISTMWLNVQIWEYYGSKEVRICEIPKTESTIK